MRPPLIRFRHSLLRKATHVRFGSNIVLIASQTVLNDSLSLLPGMNAAIGSANLPTARSEQSSTQGNIIVSDAKLADRLPDELPADPMHWADAWLKEAIATKIQRNPNSMTIAQWERIRSHHRGWSSARNLCRIRDTWFFTPTIDRRNRCNWLRIHVPPCYCTGMRWGGRFASRDGRALA